LGKALLYLKSALLASLVTILISCTFYPKVVHDADNDRCQLSSNKLTLEVSVPNSGFHCNGVSGDGAAACLAVAGIYSVTTAIVSGSIVLIGNTAHWLEKQGKCTDDKVAKEKSMHIQSMQDKGGQVIDYTDEYEE